MDEQVFYRIQAWATNIIIILSSLLVLIKFSKQKDKNSGIYMILILTISDLLFPILNMSTNFLATSFELAVICGCVITFVNRFSIVWSAAIAYMTYQIIVKHNSIDTKSYVIKSFIVCTILVGLYPLIIVTRAWGIAVVYLGPGLFAIGYPESNLFNQFMYLVSFDFAGYLLPIILTFYWYSRVSKAIKETYGFLGNEDSHSHSNKLYCFSFIPLICFVPEVIADCIYIFKGGNYYPFWVMMVVSVLHRSWGFLNLFAYWFMSPLGRDRSQSYDSIDHEESYHVEFISR